MIISERMKERLTSACRKPRLQGALASFLQAWTNRRASGDACNEALHTICADLDRDGNFHDAEVVMSSGLIILEQEPERRRRSRNNALLAVGGLVLGGLFLRALTRPRSYA